MREIKGLVWTNHRQIQIALSLASMAGNDYFPGVSSTQGVLIFEWCEVLGTKGAKKSIDYEHSKKIIYLLCCYIY